MVGLFGVSLFPCTNTGGVAVIKAPCSSTCFAIYEDLEHFLYILKMFANSLYCSLKT